VVVAHVETLAAEGIAAALARYPAIVPVGIATSTREVERVAGRADAVAIDARIPGAQEVAGRLRRDGVRVVVMGPASSDEDADGIAVGVDAPVAHLAAALVPGARRTSANAPGLTPREGQVLRLAAKGLAAKQSARALAISPKTVEHHKARAFRRLGVPNLAAAVAVLAEGEDRAWSRSST
jgi:DNA-binding CsgD family transcriptional regulator